MGLLEFFSFIQKTSDRLPWDYIDLAIGIADEAGAIYMLAEITIKGYHESYSILACIISMYFCVALGIFLDLIELRKSCRARNHRKKYDYTVLKESEFESNFEELKASMQIMRQTIDEMPLTVMSMWYVLDQYQLNEGEKDDDDVSLFVIVLVWQIISMFITIAVLVIRFRTIYEGGFDYRQKIRIVLTVILFASYVFHLNFG